MEDEEGAHRDAHFREELESLKASMPFLSRLQQRPGPKKQ